MCYNSILPTAISAEKFNKYLMNLTYVFNRWLKMLTSYGKLDEDGFSERVSLMSRVIKDNKIDRR